MAKNTEKFISIVAAEHCSTYGQDLSAWATDTSRYSRIPWRVIKPKTAPEIASILKLCHREDIPVVARGAGTGTTGGAVPAANGVVIDLSRMNRIIAIDSRERVGIVEPMVINDSFRQAAALHGLYYPPDPASLKTSSLGGNAAENSGGLHCVKYGVTRDFVLGLEFVTMTGHIIQSGYFSGGYDSDLDLTPLLIGSEGTLGIITKLALKLIPKPGYDALSLVRFHSLRQAAGTISDIVGAGVIPSTLEFMDAATLEAVFVYCGGNRPEQIEAVLLIEVDGHSPRAVQEQQRKIELICRRHQARSIESALSGEEKERLWELRRNVSPSLKSISTIKINEDVVVLRSRIPALVERVVAIAGKYRLNIVSFGHAGDGNVHVNIMTDEDNPAEFARVEPAVTEIFRAALELDGSISGEHGIGLAKKKWLPLQLSPPLIQLHKRLKKAFDSRNLMNPGKIF